MLMWLISIALAAAAIGAVLLALGLRGRRVNDHPHCRRCRFDLSGLDIGAASAKCPECGGELAGRRTIRIGARRRRPRLIVSGAAVLLLLVAAGAGVVWVSKSNINWTPHKPAWLLEHEAFRDDGLDARIAAIELLRRADEDALSESRHRRIAERAARSREALTSNRMLYLCDIIEHAWRRGVIEPEVLRDMAKNVARFELDPPPLDAGPDGPIHVPLNFHFRWSGSAVIGLALDCEFASARIGDQPLHRVMLQGGTGEVTRFPREYFWSHTLRPMPNDDRGALLTRTPIAPESSLPLGEHDIDINIRWRLRTGDPRRGHGRPFEEASMGSEVIEWHERHTTRVRIIPEEELSPIAIVDDSLATAVADALAVSSLTIRRQEGMRDYMRLSIDIHDLPVTIAGDFFLRSGERVWPMRFPQIIMPDYQRTGVDAIPEDFDAEMVDIIIRPRPEYARFADGVREFWGREIVIRDVPVVPE
ncbi:MAG: hypothetical protein EA376_02375 [Phycisphaeraceae bacterium]|nr:MAG: hypothetical protein EA376_02375 [Phycisphaeraceae bacterium]